MLLPTKSLILNNKKQATGMKYLVVIGNIPACLGTIRIVRAGKADTVTYGIKFYD